MLAWITKMPCQFFLILLTLGLFNVGSVSGATPSSDISDEPGWKFAYDNSGRISKVIDAAGRTTDYQYVFDDDDRLHKLTRTTADGSNVILQFDERGRRTSMRDKVGTVFYEYDDLGRLILVQREESPAVTYSYDTLDRIKVLQVGDFYRIEYTYDFLGRLKSMKTPAGIVRYDYLTGQGKVVRTLPNGVKTILDYAPNGKLQKITHGLASNANDTSYQVLAEYSYRYRPDGLIGSIKEGGVAGQFERSYEYDKVGRLIQVSDSKGLRYRYEYDPVGNHVKTRSSANSPQEFTYDWAGRLTSLNGVATSHDAAGNLTVFNLAGTKQKYRFNQENQLVDALDGKVKYRYDGEGQLIWRKTNRADTNFILHSLAGFWQPLVMDDESGHRTLVIWDGTTPLMMIQNDKVEYLLRDQLGSVRLMIDSKGEELQRFSYEPFGAFADADMVIDFAPRFTGLFWDKTAKTYLTMARTYIPQLGRFLQTDPILRVPNGSQNNNSLYQYSGNDPVNYIDLDGRERIAINNGIIDWTADLGTMNDMFRRYERQFEVTKSQQLIIQLDKTAKKITDDIVNQMFSDNQIVRKFLTDVVELRRNTPLNKKLDFTPVIINRSKEYLESIIKETIKKDFGVNINKEAGRFNQLKEDLYYISSLRASAIIEPITNDINSIATPGTPTIRESTFNNLASKLDELISRNRITSAFPSKEDNYVHQYVEMKFHRLSENIGGDIANSVLNNKNLLRGFSYDIANLINHSVINNELDLKPIIKKHYEKKIEQTIKNYTGLDILFDDFNKDGIKNAYIKKLSEIIKHKILPSTGELEILAELRNPSGKIDHNKLTRDLYRVFQRFETNNHLKANIYRSAINQHFGFNATQSTRSSIPTSKYSAIFAASINTFNVLAKGITTGLYYLNVTLTSMQVSNTPTHIQYRNKNGWTGDQTVKLPSGDIYRRQGSVNVDLFKGSGIIKQNRIDTITSKYGKYERVYNNETKADFFTRLAFKLFPVKYFYDPLESTVTTKIHSKTSYRAITRGGYTNFMPTYNSTPPSSVDIVKSNIEAQIKKPKNETSYRKRDLILDMNKYYWLGDPPDPPPVPVISDDHNIPFGSADVSNNNLHSTSHSLMSPSPVGGVYLGGSDQALDSIGLIEGISLDSNNNLILLSETGKKIDLPSLRIDDVVTVFRSVYLNGEGPTVTIDPNPVDPEGSAMIVRHSKATEDTYVGWVLFQTDRLMKGYTLGADNDTAKDIKSAVPEYDKVLNTIYFGGESPEKRRKKGHWERFWIIPAEARRFGTDKTELTLFDVPLKVKTQSMKWVNGELKDDLKGKSSPGATAFTDWFTGKYDQIAEEQYLMPPPESGITKPVPVFIELRRIALITAIAEKLRDQGVSLPFWMRDYEVQPVPIEKFTPGLKVTRSNQRITAHVYGGAQMSAADKDVKDYSPVSNLANLPKKEQQSVRKKIKLVDTLEKAIQHEMVSAEPFEVRQFKHKDHGYQAVKMPGGETKALAPATLTEVDLSIPIDGGHSIHLPRYYNSFFNPNGLWGKGWTLDLPHLEKIRVPVHRKGSEVHFKMAYELITPLNSVYTRFSRIEKVPELNDSKLQVPDHPSGFFGIADSKPVFLSGETNELIRKDGVSWHFSKAGQLVAVEDGGFRTVYERDNDGHLTRIAGLLGRYLVASIDLKYDESGKLSSATAYKAESESDKTIINYRYDNVGRLSGIESESGRVGIRYKDSWVTAVTYQAKGPKGTASQEIILRGFEYNPKGQLLSETGIDGTRTTYQVVSDSKGSTVTAVASGQASGTNFIRYDPGFRPVEARYANGSQATWDYSNSGGSVLHIKEADGTDIRITESADQRQRIAEFDNEYKIASEFDSAGRLTSVSENGHTLMEQEWSSLGNLRVVKSETQSEHYKYDEDGLLSRIIQAPPNEKGDFSHFQVTSFDPAGRPVEIKDDRGRHLSVDYDANGELAAMFDRRDGNNYGFKIDRDQSGRIQKIRSSWENRQYAYDANGHIKNLTIAKGGINASAEWKSGLLHKVRQFDGGESTMSYYETPGQEGLIKRITTPNQLTMTYEYDPNNQLRGVNVGNIYKLKIDYDASGNLTGWRVAPPGRSGTRKVVSRVNPGTASSPVSLLRPAESLEARRADSRFASEGIRDLIILDHSVVDGKPNLLLAVNGKVRSANKAVAVEFDRLLRITATTVGPVDQLQKMWADFIENHLTGFSKVQTWEAHNRQIVRLKPRLIIKSNQTNYKYTNLERIPALVDNFNVYITHNPNVTATSLVKKIRDIPRLGRDNVLFVFRLPEMEAGLQRRWQSAITKLQKIVGQDNVRFDPSRTELQVAMNLRDKDVVVFEFTHTEQGIVLKGNEKYQADDILRGESLSHIKYLIGLSCCNLQKLEQGRFVDSLQKKGVGIVDGPAREVNADVGLRRLEQMIEIMRNIELYEKLPLDYLQDVIDQLQKIEHGGMIKVGERVVERLEACA